MYPFIELFNNLLIKKTFYFLLILNYEKEKHLVNVELRELTTNDESRNDRIIVYYLFLCSLRNKHYFISKGF